MNLYCSFALNCEPICVGKVGAREESTPVVLEPALKYHPDLFAVLTTDSDPVLGPCMVGSLTGAVSS